MDQKVDELDENRSVGRERKVCGRDWAWAHPETRIFLNRALLLGECKGLRLLSLRRSYTALL